MSHPSPPAIAIVGVGAVLPDAPDAATFWSNVKAGRCSIREIPDDRWDPALYYDPDPRKPDKTYSKIGAWVQDWSWDPLAWRLPIPPRVSDAMDRGQKWAIIAARQALQDYGYPERPLDPARTAVIVGNAMAGDDHYTTALRIQSSQILQQLAETSSFGALSAADREALLSELRQHIDQDFPAITEDTMPGELSNVIAGRIAALFDFHGPSFTTDAACASTFPALSAAVQGLQAGHFDAALTGAVDANMNPVSFVKFCKIGALSATGSRPYGEGADGFVMGEGAALFLLKRLDDAERAGDRIYAVIRAIGGASDGRGKGITAPNPVGQRLAIERGWQLAGLRPDEATLIEGHGTSTAVGDRVELETMREIFGELELSSPIPIGSVKSNIGHLKSAAGAAGLLKAAFALSDKMLPPTLGCDRLNPGIDPDEGPIAVNTELRPWEVSSPDAVRRVGVSAFGFGGTNFHVVLEEHLPGRSAQRAPVVGGLGASGDGASGMAMASEARSGSLKAPLRGIALLGAESEQQLAERLSAIEADPPPFDGVPRRADLQAPVRLAIDFTDEADLVRKAKGARDALGAGNPAIWRALRARGVHRGRGPAPKIAFLFTGQGSQYVNMGAELRAAEPIVAETFDEADQILKPLLGQPLSELLFVDPDDAEAVARSTESLRQTAVTQPAVLTVDLALTRLLAGYGIEPDMVMGHSLGEYGALVAAGVMSLASALEAVSARGREMTKVAVADCGLMAAVFAPLDEIIRIVAEVDGYVTVANINSNSQAVIGGATAAVQAAVAAVEQAGHRATLLPVSHAFHTSIVAPASEPLQQVLRRLPIGPPRIPVVANVDGELYPMHANAGGEVVEILGRQIASPVQFVRGLHTLYDAGVRAFVEVGPKQALHGFVEDVLGEHDDVISLFTNHPKLGDVVAFNQALAGLYAAGLGHGRQEPAVAEVSASAPPAATLPSSPPRAAGELSRDRYLELGQMFADVLTRGMQLVGGAAPAAAESISVTGAALGLPGTAQVFDDANVGRLLGGEQLIGPIPELLQQAMIDKRITRVVKERAGGAHFETLDSTGEAIKLSARLGELDMVEQFGLAADRTESLDITTRLAIGAGVCALRDAGIPLVRHYKRTTTGTSLPEHWRLPTSMQDDTGVIFASAFPGYDEYARQSKAFYEDRARRERLAELSQLRGEIARGAGEGAELAALDERIRLLEAELEAESFHFDSHFLFKVLAMGHCQFAEHIGARGPNTQVNAACASGAQAVTIAHDWIRSGRCRRVIVISGDAVTSDHLMEWIGGGFLASGAAATDERVEDAATPFDRRRHGLVLGAGAAAVVLESEESWRERGIQPIAEIVASQVANSAFHGSRLDVEHIAAVVERVVAEAEQRLGLSRDEIASRLAFISHETYTPARGGSAQAEVFALRQAFGPAADKIVVANTKGFTGHPMAAGIEEAAGVKMLETGIVPPVANFREIDPELGALNLSRGGAYPIDFTLRLAAGFGSQITLYMLRRIPAPDGRRPRPSELGFGQRIFDRAIWEQWLGEASGYSSPAIEVAQSTLRITDQGPPSIERQRPARYSSVPPSFLAGYRDPSWLPPPLPPIDELDPAAAAASPAPAPEARAEAPPGVHPPAPSPAGATTDSIEAQVLAIIADATGYPVDMLASDLDLEADLGIDTVKQAEMFAAIREAWGVARDDAFQLRDFPTIGHVVRFVLDHAPEASTAGAGGALVSVPSRAHGAEPSVELSVAAPSSAGATTDSVEAQVLAIIADKTGYPVDMLASDLDLEADLGIDTVK
ncbi:MAG: acyltransferase domain-containing protein, partial [Deltaproteobacteria bacterium]|nr:acyltransferase domain-containing protein [Deltaproteobacteria bacterium]MBW2532775.1 acyltransferase domain-containing protein [Deltaproteobacteria bacterium]